jgi:glycosyltransferase involved in cell wall biosynthesis
MTPIRPQPRISIGMPLYNCERFLPQAIDSHLCQTYEDFELIITDNASTDRSAEICQDYAAKDPRIKYYRNPENVGAGGNFRRCFELSNGEFFRWTPSDDFVGPSLLERCVEVLDRDPSILVAYPRTRLIDANGATIRDYDEDLNRMEQSASTRFKEVARRLGLCNLQYGLTRRSTLARTGLIRNYIGGDVPFILELSLYGKFFEIPEQLFFRRMHAAASSAMKDSRDLMALYDPKKREQFFARLWVHLGANLTSVARAPIPVWQKLQLSTFLLCTLGWSRREYFSELTGAATHAARKMTILP